MFSFFCYTFLISFNSINISRKLFYKIINLFIEFLLAFDFILLLKTYSKYLTTMNILPYTSNSRSTIFLVFFSNFYFCSIPISSITEIMKIILINSYFILTFKVFKNNTATKNILYSIMRTFTKNITFINNKYL